MKLTHRFFLGFIILVLVFLLMIINFNITNFNVNSIASASLYSFFTICLINLNMKGKKIQGKMKLPYFLVGLVILLFFTLVFYLLHFIIDYYLFRSNLDLYFVLIIPGFLFFSFFILDKNDSKILK